MINILDNLDSFTFNLKEFFDENNLKSEVIDIIKKKTNKKSKIVIFSPGFGQPFNSKNTIFFLKKNYKNISFIGICLGHQIISVSFKGKIILSKKVLHGKNEISFSNKKTIFNNNLPLINKFCRYNSLVVLKNKFFNTTKISKHNEVMLIEHKIFPILGIQFHPESVLSLFGKRILKNILFFLKNYENK